MYNAPECWLDITGSIKYQISNYGNIRRKLKNGKVRNIKTYIPCNKKWVSVKVDYNGKYKEYEIHKLVAATFLDKPAGDMVIAHKNLIVTDNYAGNLYYTTRSELGKRTGGQAKGLPVVKIDPKTGEILDFYKSMAIAGKENYLHRETIRQAVVGMIKTAGGFIWRKERDGDFD